LMRALPPRSPPRGVQQPRRRTAIYLAESIRAWPDQAGLAARLAEAGWTGIGWRNLSGGQSWRWHRAKNPFLRGIPPPIPRGGRRMAICEKNREPTVAVVR